MRVLFVSPCLFEEHYGGVQKSAQIALEALCSNQQTTETRVLCYGARCQRKSCVETGMDPCSHSKLSAVLRALRLRTRPGTILLFWHLDLLRLLPLLGRRAARICLFLHGVECWRPMDARMRNLLARVDTFLTNSDFTWARFLEMNPRWIASEHRTVALGLDCPVPNIPAPAGVPAAIILGRTYRSENYKGHRELIEAWPTVLRSRNEAELWVVGGGDAADDLKGLAVKLGVERQVRFFGAVEEGEKQSLLRSARCLVLPSRGEGFGLAYLEAMRIGRPCLTGTEDAGHEVVNPPEAGLAVAPSDISGLAASILRLLSPGPEWQHWSARAKNRYESAYTAAHFQKRLLHVLLKGDRPAGILDDLG